MARAANLRGVPCSLTVKLRCGAAVPCALILLFVNIITITILFSSMNGAVVRRFGMHEGKAAKLSTKQFR